VAVGGGGLARPWPGRLGTAWRRAWRRWVRTGYPDRDVSDDRNGGGTLILARPLVEPVAKNTGEACLVLLHPPGPDLGRRMALSKETYQVGRENADLVIPRSSVSRAHSRLSRDGDGHWWVQDLGSTNGTFVNEERVVSRRVEDGDQIRFGDVIYKFLFGSNIESAYHEQIHLMAIQDSLTGVANKRHFAEFLEREVAGALRHQHPLALVMFDVDHFKKVNDTHGHLAGDAVLKDLAARIRPRIRREDLFARYGGEEFACVLPSTPLAGATVFAEALRVLICDRPCVFDNTPISYTISLGVSCMQGEKVDGTWLVKKADENLYAAKRSGRNRVVPSLADLVG
jgi:two-component system cell cycle response regulator